MTVHFVGAGPGAADLITVRAQRLLEQCSVCLYAGSLVPAEVLAHCPPDAKLIDTAGLTLDQILAAIAAADAAGVRSTAVIIVGKVLAASGFRDSHLYSAARDRSAQPHP